MDNLNEKYGLVFLNGKRYYSFSLENKRIDLEHSKPFYLKLGDTVLENHCWGGLIQLVCNYFLKRKEIENDNLEKFRVDWSKTHIFLREKRVNSDLPLLNGMFVNTNHTSVHCCWLIREIIMFFEYDITKAVMIIHKQGNVEPKEIKETIINANKEGYKKYLIDTFSGMEESIAKKQIDFLTKADEKFTPYVAKNKKSIFLIDNLLDLWKYRMDLFIFLKEKTNFSEKNTIILRKIVDNYYEYQKYILKENNNE